MRNTKELIMKQKIILLLTLMNLTGLTYAYNETHFKPWTVNAAFGMGHTPDMTNNDGQSAVGRFSLGRTLFTNPYWQADIEAGIQSGNTQRLALSKESIDVLGGVPISAQIKPLLDVLIGLETEPMGGFPLIAWMKGGVAFRQLQVDRVEVNDVQAYSPEIQAGFGYRINEQATITMGYQTIWGKKPILTVNSETETGVLHHIPAQQAVLIGFSFNFF